MTAAELSLFNPEALEGLVSPDLLEKIKHERQTFTRQDIKVCRIDFKRTLIFFRTACDSCWHLAGVGAIVFTFNFFAAGRNC